MPTTQTADTQSCDLAWSPARQALGHQSQFDPNYVVVRSGKAARGLSCDLRDQQRILPIVGLAPRLKDDRPAFQPTRLRDILDPRVRIYFIPDRSLRRRLRQRTGSALALDDGTARIWWPGVIPDSDPDHHPLIGPLAPGHEAEALKEFVRTLDFSRPVVRQRFTELLENFAVIIRRLGETERDLLDLAS